MLRFIGFYDYTVILTYLSLLSAVFGMILGDRGCFGAAALCLLISGICDAFDGIVARSKKNRTEDEKAFGIQIDSLCDLVSFGVFPAMLCHDMGVDSIIGICVLMAYCLCAVIRLAFFNVIEGKRQQTEGGCNKTYRGLPVTSISLLLPPVCWLRSILGVAFPVFLTALMAAVAFLFVFDFSVKKPDWTKLLRKHK